MTPRRTFSPSPWKLSAPNQHSPTFKIRDASDFLIVEIFNGANARLITQAPEMLSLLELVMLDSVHGDTIGQHTLERIRATILQATGRA